MTISITRYVDITSGVGAGTLVPTRALGGRIFTDNNLVPPQSFVQFTSADEVKAYFGSGSEEYARAAFYFGWTSKSITVPQAIQFARWVDTAVAPMIFGSTLTTTLAQFQLITNGTFGLTIGGVVEAYSSLNFSAAASLSDVASALQVAIRAGSTITKSCTTTNSNDSVTTADTTGLLAGMIVTGTGIPADTTIVSIDSGTAFTISNNATASATNTLSFYTVANSVFALATVSYDSTKGAFNFVGGLVGNNTITVQAGIGGTDISALIGWNTITAILADGSAVEAIEDAISDSASASNNFGSFTIMATVTLDQVIAAAEWNRDQGVNYIFTQAVTEENYAAWSNVDTGLGHIGGSTLTLAPLATEFPEQVPMMILAATDYLEPNSVQNYMFQEFDLTPSVSDDSTANALDAARVNYYGVTQNAGTQLAFYQRGFMFGIATDPEDQNTYANEIWLKAALTAQLMTLLLALPQLAVNSTGRSQILAILQSVITIAVNNGTISVGKDLTVAQQLFITEESGDPNAKYQVQTIGYWVNVTFEVIPETNPPQYQAVYKLIYSKDDVVRKIKGGNVLI